MKASPPPTPAAEPPPSSPAAGEAPTSPVSEPPAPAGADAGSKNLTWPAWHGGADWATALLVIVAGFLGASFVARNSDLWMHLATGRALVAGEYFLGSDPFSYTTAGRPWVNSSWLYDLLAYGMYSINPVGKLLVAAKAAAFAGAFALLFLIRRPGQSLWPWCLFAGAGIMATLPLSALRPFVGSMLFLAVTWVLLFARTWEPGKWRQPAILAGLFAIWANLDAWFLLGPLTVGLTLLGEMLHRKLTRGNEEPTDDALFPIPPVPDLTRAFFLGTAACLLNPTFLIGLAKSPADAVSQLVPQELGWTLPKSDLARDTELYTTVLSPISAEYAERPTFGYNWNGLASVIVFLGGAAALGAGYSRVRATHIVLWVGFALLATVHYRLIAFLAIVAVPLGSSHLNAISSRIRLGTAADPRSRVAITASGVARIVTLSSALLMLAIAYPGWLHTQKSFDAALANRVEWGIEPDAGLVRAAKVLEQWRSDDRLPADLRGLHLSPDFGNILAWYAPKEKTFVDGRLPLHAPTLPDLLTARRDLYGSGHGESYHASDIRITDVREVAAKYKADYLTVTSSIRLLDTSLVFRILLDPGTPRPTLWHLDGRSAFLAIASGPAVEKLTFDPVRIAFGPEDPLPDGPAIPLVSEKRELFDEYVYRPRVESPRADDALVYWQFLEFSRARLLGQDEARSAVVGNALGVLTPPQPDPLIASSLLILRSSREAVAETPNRPEGYLGLCLAYRYPMLPVADESERQRQLICGMVRFLARIDGPPSTIQPMWRRFYLQEGLRLTAAYLQTLQVDLALATAKKLPEFARTLSFEEIRNCVHPETAEYLARQLNLGQELGLFFTKPKENNPLKLQAEAVGVFEKLERTIEAETARHNDQYEKAIQQGGSRVTSLDRFLLALRLGLVAKGIELYYSISEKDREGNPHLLGIIELFANALMQAGKVEEAAEFVEILAKELGDKAIPEARMKLRQLQYQLARIRGNYRQAAELWIELGATRQSRVPPEFLPAVQDPFRKSLANGAVGGFLGLTVYGAWITPAQQSLLVESNAYYTLGVYALTDGNVAEARKHFEHALRPQGVPLAAIGEPVRAAEIQRYLRLIREAEQPRTAK